VSNIEILGLRETRLGPEGPEVMLRLLGEGSPQAPLLKVLDLGGNNLKPIHAESIGSIASSRPLEVLLLDGNQLGSKGAQLLSDSLSKSKVIKTLDLSMNEVKPLSRIRTFTLNSTPKSDHELGGD